MPKRSAQSQIERYERKIRKIEQKERKRRIISPIDSSSDEEDNGNHEHNCDAIPDSIPIAPDIAQEAGSVPIDIPDQNEDITEPGLHEEAAASGLSDLDPEILAALGESTSESPDY
ncbi:jg24562, partial [Pararge aegeria aegeria]